MRTRFALIGCLLAVMLLGTQANAATMTFSLDNAWANLSTSDSNLSVQLVDNSGLSFDLGAGESYTFDLLTVTCWHCKANFDLDVGLDFSHSTAELEGSGSLRTTGFLVLWFTQRRLAWDGPVDVVSSLGTYTVALEAFSAGKLGHWGKQFTLAATISNVAPAAVPLPAAGWLFGSALF